PRNIDWRKEFWIPDRLRACSPGLDPVAGIGPLGTAGRSRENGCECDGCGDLQERRMAASGHRRGLKRGALAVLFPWHTDPPRFWLWGVAKNRPFATEGPIHGWSNFNKGGMSKAGTSGRECGYYRTYQLSSKPYSHLI